MADTSIAYIPGVCNINRQEIAYRRKAGYAGLAVFVLIAAALIILDINRLVRILLFVPAFVAAIGFLQAKNKFCVGYGASGQQNAGEGSAAATKVIDTDALARDKARSRRMNLQAAGVALLATLILLALPV